MGNNVYLSYLTAFYDIISNLWEIQNKQMSACKYRTETSCFKHMLLNLKRFMPWGNYCEIEAKLLTSNTCNIFYIYVF